MRRLALFLLLALAGCATRPAPLYLKLGSDGTGVLEIRAQGPWSLEAPPWLAVFPRSGSGPAAVYLHGRGERLPDLPEILGTITVFARGSGYPVRLRWPLIPVRGVVYPRATPEEALPAAPLAPPSLPEPLEKLVKLKDGRILRLPAESPTPPGALWSEPNAFVWPLGEPYEPEDPYYSLESHLFLTGARFAGLKPYTRRVVVAVIDTGVRYDHPDLEGALLSGSEGAYDFVENDPDPTDNGGSGPVGSHGTHVTGIVAARANGQGVVGAAWPAPVRALPLRVIGPGGTGTVADVADAIRYAAGLPVVRGSETLVNPNPAQILNLSLGTTEPSRTLCEAVADATRAGALVVAAAGNSLGDRNLVFYPAACEGALSVAATDLGGWHPPAAAWYSVRNDWVALAAPGGDLTQDANGDGHPDGVLSTTWDYREGRPSYGFYMGTSQAAPQVAAAAALLLASGEAESSAEAGARLLETATDLGPPGPDPDYGSGFLNLTAALGVEPPPGRLRVVFEGPATRSLPVQVGEPFATHLPAGTYRVLVCRDDSENGLCDAGEPKIIQAITILNPLHALLTEPPEIFR